MKYSLQPEAFFYAKSKFSDQQLAICKNELNEQLHIACKTSYFVYSAGFLLFCFNFFFMFRWQKTLKHPFPLLGVFFFFFCRKMQIGFFSLQPNLWVCAFTFQHIFSANLYVCCLGHESHSWTGRSCGFDIHLDSLKWYAWPTEDIEIYSIQPYRAAGSCLLRKAAGFF